RLAALPPDVLVTVPGESARAMDFHRAPELIELGHRLTVQALDEAFGPDTREPGAVRDAASGGPAAPPELDASPSEP
ncbi:MAG TPA: hypothetical protein PLE12_08565, partial [Propionicimonas sp.]|nr:hypothetical protein [Propionicimonas sp.]